MSRHKHLSFEDFKTNFINAPKVTKRGIKYYLDGWDVGIPKSHVEWL